MKQKMSLLLCLSFAACSLFAQKGQSVEKNRRVGVHLTSMDVATPKAWKNNTGAKSLAGFKEQDLGFTASYWQSVYKQVDLSVKASLMFHDYAANDRGVYDDGYNQIGFEVEPAVNINAFDSKQMFNAFTTVGLGFGVYSNKFGAYVPAGLGLSANLKNNTHILLQAQYRFTLTEKSNANALVYSLGIIQSMGK